MIERLLYMKKRRKACRFCSLWGKPTVLYEVEKPNQQVDILFLGVNPGRQEAKEGKPFCGPSGKILRKAVSDIYGKSFNVAYSNSMLCATNNEKEIQNKTACLEYCRFFRDRIFLFLKPILIVAVGSSSKESLDIMDDMKQAVQRKDYKYTARTPRMTTSFPVAVSYHPASVLYSGRNPDTVKTFYNSLINARNLYKEYKDIPF